MSRTSLASLLVALLVAGCSGLAGPVDRGAGLGEDPDPTFSLGGLGPSAAAEDTLGALPAQMPYDESLLQKILRQRPELRPLEDLYMEGSTRWVEGDLDRAEAALYDLQEAISDARHTEPDSLSLLYLGSLDRRLVNLVEILTEERFFSESYAPFEQDLATAYDSLRIHLALPSYLVPEVEASVFERELLGVDNEAVQKWIAYFTGRGASTYQVWLGRRARYGALIEAILEEEGLPRELIHLSMIESGLQAEAVSRASAVGWWQFLRSTARMRGLLVNDWVDERRDVEKSTRAASQHLKLMYGMFGNWPLALAAYNAGEYRVQRALGLQGQADYWGLRLPSETRDYVPKFIAAARIGADPVRYGFAAAAPDSLVFDTIEVRDAFSLDQIARVGGFPLAELERLNPQLVAGCTPPNLDAYALRVPSGRGETTIAAVESIPQDERISWRKHRIRSGDTLIALARQYRTSVESIMQLNGIRDARRIRIGHVLTIPYPRGARGVEPLVASASPNAPRASRGGAARYRVRSGDTLISIAREHSITVDAIRGANRLSGSRIVVGQVLQLPGAEGVGAGGRYEVSEATHEQREYRVRRGDTLSAIGRLFEVDVAALMAWNALHPNSTLHPGDRIKVWIPRSR